jgi:hypothetical protein
MGKTEYMLAALPGWLLGNFLKALVTLPLLILECA